MIPKLAGLSVDPFNGQGAYRRRLKITALSKVMLAQIDDSFHNCWMIPEHDRASVSAIDAGFLRAPTTVYGRTPVRLWPSYRNPAPLTHAAGMNGMCWPYLDERRASGFGLLDFVRDDLLTVRAETRPLFIRTRLKGVGC